MVSLQVRGSLTDTRRDALIETRRDGWSHCNQEETCFEKEEVVICVNCFQEIKGTKKTKVTIGHNEMGCTGDLDKSHCSAVGKWGQKLDWGCLQRKYERRK